MTEPLLAVQAAGGPGIGAGHLGRGLALVQAWVRTGGRAVLIDRGAETIEWADRYAAAGAELVAASELAARQPAWLVVDGYAFGAEDVDAGHGLGARVLVPSDHGSGLGMGADVVVEPTPPAAAAPAIEGTTILRGPAYVPLRSELVAARSAAGATRSEPERAQRVVLAPGGHPAAAVLTRFESMAGALRADHDVTWLQGVTSVAEVLSAADLVIAAGGSTAWELCTLGRPALLTAVAANQEPVVATATRAGAALDLGPVAVLEPEAAAVRARRLGRDVAARSAMAAAGRALVDGRGAARVAAVLRGALWVIRPVTGGDADLLFAWANDPATRANAFATDPIPWSDHVRWLDARLADPSASTWLVETGDDEPLAVVRFDPIDPGLEISVTLDPARRGRGLAASALDAAVRRLRSGGDDRPVLARIKPGNAASIAAFSTAGFDPDGQGGDGRSAWVRYVRGADR